MAATSSGSTRNVALKAMSVRLSAMTIWVSRVGRTRRMMVNAPFPPASRATAERAKTSQKWTVIRSSTSSTLDRPAEQTLEGGDAAVRDAARHDQVEVRQIRRHVERKPVTRDPPRNANANRGELFAAHPDAGQPVHASGRRRRSWPPCESARLPGRGRSDGHRSGPASGRRSGSRRSGRGRDT